MASKNKSIYVCSNCGADFAKWMGKCPSCGQWSTIHEEIVRNTAPGPAGRLIESSGKPQRLSEVSLGTESRIATSCAELDRVLGGGLVAGSVTLLG
ncbi:MAG: DNA repair protein RadA, partial [Bacteroidales bacterium]|nr:DNA repair protein RadA [Bacteroidales bacterium]